MSNSTLSGNQTGLGGTCNVTDGCFSESAGFGGGLMVDLQAADLNNVTITNNRGNGAGGIHHFTGGGPFRIFLTLNNSIVAGNLNTDGQPADCNSVSGGSGDIISEGYNLVGAGTGCPSGGTGDLTTSDPKLGALADNGGPTKTHELLTDSPAIDAGPPTSGDTICPPPSTDQRGVNRPQDGNGDSISRCDIGSFELVPNTAPTAVDDSYTINEETMLTANGAGSNPPGVLANDTDPDSDALQILEVGSPANGTASIDDNGTSADPTDDFVTYTPDADYNGTDTFTYTISDGQGGTDTANVHVTVNPVNDTPQAADDTTTYTMAEDANAITIEFGALVSDLETSNADLTYNIPAPPAAQGSVSGTGSTRSFDSADNFTGSVDIFCTVTDRGDPDNCGTPNTTSCAAAETSLQKKVTVTVTLINDAPTANAQSLTTNEDINKLITLAGNDIEGDTLSYKITSLPTNGKLRQGTTEITSADLPFSLSSNQVTYDPNDNYNNTAATADAFDFKVNDGTVDSAAAASGSQGEHHRHPGQRRTHGGGGSRRLVRDQRPLRHDQPHPQRSRGRRHEPDTRLEHEYDPGTELQRRARRDSSKQDADGHRRLREDRHGRDHRQGLRRHGHG
jgi:hypothetical protein